jgi:hypothetical protein
MMRYLRILVSAVAIGILVATPVLAQMAPAPKPAPAAPGATASEVPKEKQVEGPVKAVDPLARTVKVGWFLGLLRTTLEVNDDTQIMADGRKGSLLDIREGAKVKAAYETREGKNIAKSIEVMPAEQKTAASDGAPARPGVPMGEAAGSPQGSRSTQ